MSVLVFALAALGFLAVARRVVVAGFRLLGRGVDRFVAGETAEVRARRGDLTGLAEASGRETTARRAQLASLGVFSFWVLLLVAPALTPWPRLLYAAYSALWLVPRPVSRPA